MLQDILRKKLKVVFVGINPGLRSDKVGHYYAHHTNKFWQLLADSNLTPYLLTSKQDYKLTDFEIGLTDVVRQASRGSKEAEKLLSNENLTQLNEKIRKFSPKMICFNGKKAFKLFFCKEPEKLGLQSEKMNSADIFVLPSSSGTNTKFTYLQKLEYYKELKKLSKEIWKQKEA